jgi:hypothetical protein
LRRPPEAFDTTGETEGAQAEANKCKSMKPKLLSFAFIYFSESGLFNGLRPIQIKKTAAFLAPAGVVCEGLDALHCAPSPPCR